MKNNENAEQVVLMDTLDLINKVDTSVLTPEEEQEYFKRIEQGDEQAKEEFANHNLRLVVAIATHNFASQSKRKLYSMNDVIQEGIIGLMIAIDKFEWRKGFKFSTYATDWIYQTIDRAIDGAGRTVKIPAGKLYVVKQFTKIKNDLLNKNNVMPTFEEVAHHLEWTDDYIKYCLSLGIEPLSFSAKSNQYNGEAKTLGEQIGDQYSDETNEEMIDRELLHLSLEAIINKVLIGKEKEVFCLLHGQNDEGIEYNHDEVAEKLNMSVDEVVSHDHHAFQQLRASEYVETLRSYL